MGLRLQEHSSPSNGGQTTNWPDLAATATKESRTVSQLFDTHWFCRYPRPRKVIHDNGTEFKGYKFQDMYSSYGVRLQPTTVKNPRSNLVAERMNLTIGDILHTPFLREKNGRRNLTWPYNQLHGQLDHRSARCQGIQPDSYFFPEI